MRTYQPIWEQLKKNKKATIRAPAHSHKTIIQAVRKERSRDTAYTNLLRSKYMQVRLTPTSHPDKGLITFTLARIAISIEDL